MASKSNTKPTARGVKTGRKRDPATLDLLASMGLPPDFPLSPHTPSGRWYKKVRGKRHYFGPIDNPQAALDLYLLQRDDLLAGRKPRAESVEGVTVGDVVNAFLTDKRALVDSGELTAQHWHDYYRVGRDIAASFGKRRLVADLRAEDFAALRGSMAKTCGPTTLGNRIQRVRSFFKYAYEADMIPHPVKFGPGFRKPKPREVRLQRAAKPKRLFKPADLRKLVNAAGVPKRAMILLGVNCGLGNDDIAKLEFSHIDLDAGTIHYPRPKTGIDRRGILWPETVKALREAIEARPEPADPENAALVFLTARDRRPYVRRGIKPIAEPKRGQPDFKLSNTDGVAQEFRKLCKAEGVTPAAFYDLRHSFATIAEQTRDFPAVELCMGHETPDIATRYREEIGEDRLRAIAEHVRGWLGLADDSGVLAKIG